MAKTEEAKPFINPFDAGVTYEAFLKACNGKVKEYCEGSLNPEQIEWLENDLKIYQNNLKK